MGFFLGLKSRTSSKQPSVLEYCIYQSEWVHFQTKQLCHVSFALLLNRDQLVKVKKLLFAFSNKTLLRKDDKYEAQKLPMFVKMATKHESLPIQLNSNCQKQMTKFTSAFFQKMLSIILRI